VDLVFVRIQIIQQPLRVKRAAGPGDGDKNFQVKGDRSRGDYAAIRRRKQVACADSTPRQPQAGLER
jgi:hypothetical protein